MRAGTITHEEMSSIYIAGDFAAGDFDCFYKASSESGGNDVGYIIVDGVTVASDSGAGSWTAMTTQTLSAGVHFIQFVYTKDNSTNSNDDTFYIDDIVLPAFTEVNYEDFPGGVVPSVGDWTNDATDPWQSSTGSTADINGLKSKTSLADDGTSTLTYVSSSGAPAGDVIMAGFADSESGFDIFQLKIDTVEVFSDSGNHSAVRAPLGFFGSVTSGSHTYEFIYSKDGGGADSQDAGFVNLFYEPGFGAIVEKDQEAFRFYDDDGDESGSTALEAQNVDLSIDKETVFHLRIGMQTVGDAPAEAATLEHRKVGDPAWGVGGPASMNVQHINDSIANTGGANTSFTAVSSLTKAIEISNNNRMTHAGATTLDGTNREGDDLAGARLLTSTSTLTYYREAASLASDMEFQTTILEYIGAASGTNEFIVRGRHEVDLNGTTATASVDITSDGVSSAAKCIPFITGILNNATADDTDSATSTAYLTSTTNMEVNKGSASNNVKIYITLVEFTGSAWTVLHGRATAQNADTGNITLRDGSDGTSGTPTSVSAWANTAIFGQYRSNTADGTDDAIADNWPRYEQGTTALVGWAFDANHASVSATEEHVVHTLENADMDVTIFTDTSSTAGETTINITSAGLSSLDTSLAIISSTSSGTGVALPRAYRNVYLNSTTQAAHWCTRSGNTCSHYIQIVDFAGVTEPPAFEMALGAGTPGTTTSRLTGFSGTFGGGRFEEVLNPSATDTDVAEDGYREDVWSIQATADAVDAAVYEFRALYDDRVADTITEVPRVTIGTAPPSGDDTLLATLQTMDRGVGSVRAARLGGELQ
jgi:hypothetical protein